MMVDLNEVKHRHAKHYEDALHLISASYEQSGGALNRSQERFEAEWPNLRLGQEWAKANNEQTAWAEAGLAALRQFDLPELEAALFTKLGNAAQALEYFNRALAVYRELGDQDQDNEAITRSNIDQLLGQ